MAAIRSVDDDQWKSLGIPMGLVNQIKSALSSPANKVDEKVEQINTSPTIKIDLAEELKPDELLPKYMTFL